MSVPRVRKQGTPAWQYHPRSDHHSKVACWGILFDLLRESNDLRTHITEGKIAFGINHVMRDFTNKRRKALDLVLCRPGTAAQKSKKAKAPGSFKRLVQQYSIELSEAEAEALDLLPDIPVQPVGSVLVALEAKAAMTAFGKARPRLYSELADSHVTIHGDTNDAIAVGFAMINGASTFVSPTDNQCRDWGAPLKTASHDGPKELGLTIQTIEQLPRRADTKVPGFDALGVVAVRCVNSDSDPLNVTTPVTLFTEPPAPQPGDVLHYNSMIHRVAGWYASRFPNG